MLNPPCIPGKKNLVMIFICCWIWFAKILFRLFASMFMEEMLYSFFPPWGVFVWFWHQGNTGLIERVENIPSGASLVVQWLRIHLPMQGTRVWSLVQEDPTCCGATKPVHHNYWVCALEHASHNYWSLCAQSLCSTTREATAMRSPHTARKSSPHSPQLEKARMQQWRPNTAKNK